MSTTEPTTRFDAIGQSGARPAAATFVAVVALAWAIVFAFLGLGRTFNLAGPILEDLVGVNERELERFSSLVELVFAAAAFVIAIGAFRVKRWAWVTFMTWATWSILVNLMRV